MRPTHVLALVLLLIPGAAAQQHDAPRAGHRGTEPPQHRWDLIRTDPDVPAFARGKAFAIAGCIADAELEFQKGLPRKRAVAQFNLGILDFEGGRYWSASRRFRAAYRLKRDPVFRDYLRNARRLAATQSRHN